MHWLRAGGGSELLCLSSLCSPGARPAENKTGEGQEGHSDCFELDSSEFGSPQESPRRASPSDTPGFSQSDRLESLRSRGEFKDISTDAFNLICSAWRRGTEKFYYKPINPPHLGIIGSGELNYSLNNT